MSNFWKRFLAVTLSLVLTLGLAIPAGAVNEPDSSKNVTVEKVEGAKRVLPYAGKTFSEIPEQSLYKDDETVRVSIFLEAAPTIQLYSAKGIGTNASAAAYRDGLAKTQLSVAERISAQVLGGKQRRYWDWNKAWLTGADVELNIDQWSQRLQESGTYLSLGAS